MDQEGVTRPVLVWSLGRILENDPVAEIIGNSKAKEKDIQ